MLWSQIHEVIDGWNDVGQNVHLSDKCRCFYLNLEEKWVFDLFIKSTSSDHMFDMMIFFGACVELNHIICHIRLHDSSPPTSTRLTHAWKDFLYILPAAWVDLTSPQKPPRSDHQRGQRQEQARKKRWPPGSNKQSTPESSKTALPYATCVAPANHMPLNRVNTKGIGMPIDWPRTCTTKHGLFPKNPGMS